MLVDTKSVYLLTFQQVKTEPMKFSEKPSLPAQDHFAKRYNRIQPCTSAMMNNQADESSGEDELISSTGMMLINEDDVKEKACNSIRRVLPSIKLQRLSEADETGA
ncbi:hypothetical protein GCK32_018792 [Trichostrongylus colubriformis]|uniref:Uncharacterized protein n=1 Tax=Trichostrongylus colubriformis TaxID=6319 RepID=A0AAN8ESZ3_TRICO